MKKAELVGLAVFSQKPRVGALMVFGTTTGCMVRISGNQS